MVGGSTIGGGNCIVINEDVRGVFIHGGQSSHPRDREGVEAAES